MNEHQKYLVDDYDPQQQAAGPQSDKRLLNHDTELKFEQHCCKLISNGCIVLHCLHQKNCDKKKSVIGWLFVPELLLGRVHRQQSMQRSFLFKNSNERSSC